jgi:phosphomethylpyrimidine synthase
LIIVRINNEFIKTVIEQARADATETFTELAKLEGVSPEKLRDRVARGRSY